MNRRQKRKPSVLTQLRAVMPDRPVSSVEALRLGELQATKLLELMGVERPPVAELAITGLPRFAVRRMSPLPVSGYTSWVKGRWLIALNGAEPPVRQRFSLFHETKHVIDLPLITKAYRGETNPAEVGRASLRLLRRVC